MIILSHPRLYKKSKVQIPGLSHVSLLSDADVEGVWRDFYLGEEVDIATGVADGGDIEDCAILIPYFEGWNDWSCVINKVH